MAVELSNNKHDSNYLNIMTHCHHRLKRRRDVVDMDVPTAITADQQQLPW